MSNTSKTSDLAGFFTWFNSKYSTVTKKSLSEKRYPVIKRKYSLLSIVVRFIRNEPESNKSPDGLCILVHIRIVFGTNNVFLFHNFRYGTLANPIFPCKSFARRFLQTISFWKQFPTNTNQPIFSTYFLINILDNVKFCIQSQTRLGWHC